MNSRIVQMEEFLKYHAKLYKQNPGLKIKKETIYNDLMNYELQNDEVGQSLAKRKALTHPYPACIDKINKYMNEFNELFYKEIFQNFQM